MNLLARWRAHPHRAVISQAFWVGLATGLYGISYGALAAAAGMNLWQVSALSALMFAGSAQFAFVGVIEVVKIGQQIIEGNRLKVPTCSIAVYAVIFFMYFFVCWAFSLLANILEKRQKE